MAEGYPGDAVSKLNSDKRSTLLPLWQVFAECPVPERAAERMASSTKMVCYDVWAQSGTLVIASNTKQIPHIPRWDRSLNPAAIPRTDGRWGLLEYSLLPQIYDQHIPFLAWISVGNHEHLAMCTQINTFVLTPNDLRFIRHSGWPHPRCGDRIQLLIATQEATGELDHLGARPPVIAMVRAHNACFSMRIPHLTYRDILEYLAGLQRAIAELQAYIMWYDRMQYQDLATPLVPGGKRGLRGSIALWLEDYEYLRAMGVPVWLELDQSWLGHLDFLKECSMESVNIEAQLWTQVNVTPSLQDFRAGGLVHNKPLEYYPPKVDDPNCFERAARGYSSRVDSYRHDSYTFEDVKKMMGNTTHNIIHTQNVDELNLVQYSK
ncbi:hypothetical protein B0H14DRAFT_2599912 [Mycena olivaceomarginata]|nr:hypothetical protein B0H14DRAFT_2599912 [Mycena olivaceomarginata]